MAAETTKAHETAQWDDRSSDAAEIGQDQLFHLLQNERRRRALDFLRDRDGPVRMREVVDHVAAAEQGTSVDALRSDERKRVHIALYQSHLPKLDQAGIIDYDQDRGLVERTPLAAELDHYLGGAESTPASGPATPTADTQAGPVEHVGRTAGVDQGWHRYYLALAGLSLFALFASLAVGSTLVSPVTTAIAVVLAFSTLASAQWAVARGVVQSTRPHLPWLQRERS